MRAKDAGLGQATDRVEIRFEGRVLEARRGESLLAALTAAGELVLRTTESGAERGLFCGMGVCQECLVEVDCVPAQRACMTKVGGPMTVRRQANRTSAGSMPPAASPEAAVDCMTANPDIVVIGGGAAGLSAAAIAAEAGASTMLIDERLDLGGQFYKQPLQSSDLELARFDDRQFAGGRALAHRVRTSGAQVLQGAQAVGVYEPLTAVVRAGSRTLALRPRRLIVATGAYERGLPVPGWTIPGVMTTGAAQTLLRSYRVLPGRRVVVAGNGPLNLQVALELARAGADVAAVAELARRPGLASAHAVVPMACSSPDLLLQGLGYLAALRLRSVPVYFGHVLTRVERAGTGLRATLARWPEGLGESGITIEADAICMGYGFQPSNEILRALGCRHDFDERRRHLVTARDADGATTVTHVYAAGDCTGLGGARAARCEGVVAGAAAARSLGFSLSSAQQAEADRARSALPRHRHFQDALWRLFEAPRPDVSLATPDTIICRCEELSRGAIAAGPLDAQSAPGSLKRATRAGMGRCQGRYCGPFAMQLRAAKGGHAPSEADHWAPRPPVKPLTIAELAALELDDAPQPDNSPPSTASETPLT